MADLKSAAGLVRAHSQVKRLSRKSWKRMVSSISGTNYRSSSTGGFGMPEPLEARQLLSAVYYVSAAGDDLNSGLSANAAWHSISRVNAAVFSPGDSVLFEGGASFSGNLVLDAGGTATAPITVSSYGSGRAVLNAGTGTGIYVYQVAGININNLIVVGNGFNGSHGVDVYNNTISNTKFQHIAIDNVDVSGFGKNGIDIGSSNPTSGYNDIRITNTSTHDNTLRGVYVWGMIAGSSNTNVYIGASQAFNNGADGLLIGDTNGGVIERSVAHDNGLSANGTVGIWSYDSNNITIQFNESFHNQTTGDADGGGFDLDGGVTNSVVQYNYAHDNAGAGFLLGDSPLSGVTTGNTIRYNITQNDGLENYYGSITLYNNAVDVNHVTNNKIYNNTIYHSGSGAGIYVRGDLGSSSNIFANNIVQTTAGVPVIATTSATGATFVGNDYWSAGATIIFSYADVNSYGLNGFRSRGQELLNSQPMGYTVDPHLNNPGGGAKLGGAALLYTLTAYQLQPGSMLINLGMNLQTVYGINPGTRDFYGILTPQNGAADIGAGEFGGAPAALPTGWSDQDIGGPTKPGFARFDPAGAAWLLSGGGTGMGSTSDQFNYVSRSVTGDVTLLAVVASISKTDPQAQAGMMVRNDMTAGAAFVNMAVTAGGTVIFSWRSANGGVSGSSQVSLTGGDVPVWIGLVRRGNAFAGIYSTNASTWLQLGASKTVGLNAVARVGLGVTSNNSAVTTNALVSMVANDVLADSDFTRVTLPTGTSVYNPIGSAWSFSLQNGQNGAGLASNGSTLTGGNPSAPDKGQVAFLSSGGSMTQSFTLTSAGDLQLSFYAAQRAANSSREDIRVMLDGKLVASFDPLGTAYTIYSSGIIKLGVGSHTLQLVGVDTGGGGNMVLLDDVALAFV